MRFIILGVWLSCSLSLSLSLHFLLYTFSFSISVILSFFFTYSYYTSSLSLFLSLACSSLLIKSSFNFVYKIISKHVRFALSCPNIEPYIIEYNISTSFPLFPTHTPSISFSLSHTHTHSLSLSPSINLSIFLYLRPLSLYPSFCRTDT